LEVFLVVLHMGTKTVAFFLAAAKKLLNP